MMWMVDYNAECPNCGRLVTLTSRDGGAGYMCEGRADYSCDFYGESENVTHEDALKAILEG